VNNNNVSKSRAVPRKHFQKSDRLFRDWHTHSLLQMVKKRSKRTAGGVDNKLPSHDSTGGYYGNEG